MDIEDYFPLFAILFMVGIVFGTFAQWPLLTPFGWTWFLNMLWFAVGFPVLFLIGLLIFYIGARGTKKILVVKEK